MVKRMIQSFTVAEISSYIRALFEMDYRLQDVTVTGEISNMRQAASGHWYFTLKDDQAQLKCAMWRSRAGQQSYVPQNGDAVSAQGRVEVYEPRGEYQLIVNTLRPLGVGDLYARFEQLKAQLEAEGLFDPLRKRPLPEFPCQIGVVTSPEAAAFQDIQNVLRRRFPLAEVILSPTTVQGDAAPPQIVAALERLNTYTQVDVILLARGGGSIEDLWAFNDERVARAIAASRIPVIAGVGHETDFTIADFVADLRAPTPSAAAEQAVPDMGELRLAVAGARESLLLLMRDSLYLRQDRLLNRQRELGHLSPARQLATLRQRLDDWNERLERQQRQRLATWRERLISRVAALNAADPRALLARGYALVSFSHNGERLQSAQDAQPGDGLTIQLADGDVKARVEDKESHEHYRRTLF
jgi:exodeoxyribonuclease VII large subunit